MKIAIVQDDIVRKGGSEQVTLSFHKAFPEAPIYTLSYNEEAAFPEFRTCKIKTSWFGKYVRSEKNMKRFFYPFGVMAMQQLDLREYNVILQSTTHCAKYIRTDPRALVITYCHTPFRLVWRRDSYPGTSSMNLLKRKIYDLVISHLKQIDLQAAKRADWFITNSREVVPRIKKAYNPAREISVINPPVKCENFYVSKSNDDYYLVISRFEPYKKVDLVIEAFNEMPDKELVIVGSGTQEKSLKRLAGNNIVFLSGLTAQELARILSRCKALIYPQLEDYGITPLEANASGRPVIAYGKGGVTDTMIPANGDASKATAVFFHEQTKGALKEALESFETLDFDPAFIRSQAESFDEERFVKRIQDFVAEKFYSSVKTRKDFIYA